MKRFGQLLLVLSPSLALAAGCQNGSSLADKGDNRVEGKRVPLESVYSTNGQKGLKPVSAGFRPRKDGTRDYVEPYGAALEQLHREFQGGASNVFLARGDDITAAVGATWEVYTAGHPVDEPVSQDPRSKSELFWLVAHLGVSGSSPPQWLVGSVEGKAKEIRLTYAKARPGFITQDAHRYFVWAPLGKLEPGTYALQIFDDDEEQVTLLRRVKVRAK